MTNIELSLVIPCYNEQNHLMDSITKVTSVLREHQINYEIIFVDDVSKDLTRGIIHEIVDSGTEYRAVFHEINMGRGQSFADGARVARGDIIGYIDIDLEVSEEYIPNMIKAIRLGADVATGHRKIKFSTRPYHLLRHILSLGYRILFRLVLGIPIRDPESGFKFFRKEKLLELLDFANNPGWLWDTQAMAYSFTLGYTIAEIPCCFIRRADKKSTIKVFSYTVRQARELFEFSREFRLRDKKAH